MFGTIRRLLPILIGAGVILLLVTRISWPDLAAAIRSGPYLALAAFTGIHIAVSFITDATAVRAALAVMGVRRPFLEVLWARGATYLVGLLNFTLGQSVIAIHLARTGIQRSTAAGITTMIVLYNFAALAALSLTGTLTIQSLEPAQRNLLTAAAITPLAVFIVIHRARPAWMVARVFSRPLFETRLRSHALATAIRVAHFLLLALLHWIAMRIWGIRVPPSVAMALIPMLLFVAALPLTPYGIGTVQVTQIVLFGSFVPLPTAAAREAVVLAFSLAQLSAALVFQATLGYVCFLRWQRAANPLQTPGP